MMLYTDPMSNDNDFLDQHIVIIPVGFPPAAGAKVAAEVREELGATIASISDAQPDGPRPLWRIAQDIAADWKKPYFGAVPYIEALHDLDKVTDNYGADRARDIVNYFLSNANTWRGPVAKAIKAELKALVGR